MSKLIDANLIIRYLIQDDAVKALAVKKLLKSSKEPLILTDMVLAELVWTLTSYHKIPRTEVAEKLQDLLNLESIEANRPLLSRSLQIYQLFNIDFVDAYVTAYAETYKIDRIYSYDKDFDKVRTVKRLEP